MKNIICYLTDGGDDWRARARSAMSVRRFLPDVETVTFVTGDKYRPYKGERTVDLTGHYKSVYGEYVPGKLKTSDGKLGFLPLMLFGKFLIPTHPDMTGYDRLIVMDGDVEIVDGRFSRIFDEDLTGYDLMGGGEDPIGNSLLHRVRRRYGWVDGSLYVNGGLLVYDPKSVSRSHLYRTLAKEAYWTHKNVIFSALEQDAVNSFFRVKAMSAAYNMQPRWAHRFPDVKDIFAAHYAGREQKAKLYPDWERRYPTKGLEP